MRSVDATSICYGERTMNGNIKTLAISCITGLMMAGSAISPADAHGGFGGMGGGGHFGGMGGGHFAGGHFSGGHYGGARFAGSRMGRANYASNFNGHDHGHDHGDHHGHHGRFPIFIGGGYGGYYDDYYYGGDYGGCGYEWSRWQRTGNPYWRNRYYACAG
jgi:hypothetical protein